MEEVVMKYLGYFQYNSPVILSYFFICMFTLLLNKLTDGKSNDMLFVSRRGHPLNLMTYIRMFTHALGHENWEHFYNNFLYILLIGPMVEEKYGSVNLLIMMVITAGVTGLINVIISNRGIIGASGILFMLILLCSLVNLQSGKIPLTLILIILFYIFREVKDGLFKKDNVSHLAHLIGAICGFIYGFYVF